MAREPKTGIVTEDRLLALRNADHIEFKYKDAKTSYVGCYKQRFKDTPKDFIKFTFDIHSSVGSNVNEVIKIQSASFTAQYSNYDWEFQTIIGFLKLKDELELLWQADALPLPSDLSTVIHADALTLIVYRSDFRYHFKLGVYVGTDKIRMINP